MQRILIEGSFDDDDDDDDDDDKNNDADDKNDNDEDDKDNDGKLSDTEIEALKGDAPKKVRKKKNQE